MLLTDDGAPETTLSFDLGFATVNEPTAILIQESLGQIGIKTTINKIPGSNFRTELNKKVLPLYLNVFSGWLDYPEYFFIWCYHGNNSIFNTMSYQSKDMDAFIDGAVNAEDLAAAGFRGDEDHTGAGLRVQRFDPAAELDVRAFGRRHDGGLGKPHRVAGDRSRIPRPGGPRPLRRDRRQAKRGLLMPCP